MNINTKTNNILLTPQITSHLDKRLEKISRFVGEDSSIVCDVGLSRTTDHHNKGDVFLAEIHIVGHKHNVFASSEKSDLYSSIDEATDETLHSLTSSRKKYIAMARRGGAKVKDMLKGMWPRRS